MTGETTKRRWRLSARHFGDGQFHTVTYVQGQTTDEAEAAVRASKYHHVLAFRRADWKLEPEGEPTP